MGTFPFSRAAMVMGQAGLVLTGIGMLAFAPPEAGVMLALPLRAQSLAHAVDATLEAQGTIEGEGPLPGSLLVRGKLALLGPALRGRGYVLIAAPSRLCGGGV